MFVTKYTEETTSAIETIPSNSLITVIKDFKLNSVGPSWGHSSGCPLLRLADSCGSLLFLIKEHPDLYVRHLGANIFDVNSWFWFLSS